MDLFAKFIDTIVNPAVNLIFGAAVVYFVYGVVMYIREAESDQGRRDGRNHILWSTIGLFIMVSVWGIMRLIANTLGVPTN